MTPLFILLQEELAKLEDQLQQEQVHYNNIGLKRVVANNSYTYTVDVHAIESTKNC